MTKNRLIHPAVATAAGVGALVGTLVVGVVSRIHGVDPTPVESGAIVGIFTYLGGFLPGN